MSSVPVRPYRGAVDRQGLGDLLAEATQSLEEGTYQRYFQTYLFNWSRARSALPSTVAVIKVGTEELQPSLGAEPPTIFHLLLPASIEPGKARQSKLEASLDKVLSSRGFAKIATGLDAFGAWTLDFTRDDDRVTAAISTSVIQIMSYSKGVFDERRFQRSVPWADVERFIAFELMR
jgi:hypothetical protein